MLDPYHRPTDEHDVRTHPRSRLPTLTGWRFVAAAAVLANHLADSFEPTWPAYLDDYVQAIGRAGVTFFFLLSGFVLTWSSSTRDGTGRFYQRRVARVFPAHLVAWGLALVLLVATGAGTGVIEAVLGALLLQAWHPDSDIHFGGNSVAWSLSVEMLFYLLYPLVLPILLGFRARSRLLVIGLLTLAAVTWALLNAATGHGATSWSLAIFPLVRLPSFLTGVLVALHLRDGGGVPLSRGQALVLVGAASLLTPVLPGAFEPSAVLLAPFALLVAALARHDALARPSLLAGPSAIRLGEWSFALYLVHLLVLRTAESHVDLPALPVVPAVLLAAALAGASIAAAAALYLLVERPAERALRDIRRTRPTPAAPDAAPTMSG